MNDPNKIICLVKFGKQQYLNELLKKGELYFNHPKRYNEWQTREKQSGDEHEGAEWIENAHLTKIQYSHPVIGEGEFKPVKGQLAKIIQYNYFFLSYSLYALTTDSFTENDTFRIDPRNAELKDADSAIFIQEPYKFLRTVTDEIKSRNLQYEARLVEYKNMSTEGRTEMNPFTKKWEHEHQNEFRIIIENVNNKPRTIQIGSIEEYSHLVSAESMIEMTWTAKRK